MFSLWKMKHWSVNTLRLWTRFVQLHIAQIIRTLNMSLNVWSAPRLKHFIKGIIAVATTATASGVLLSRYSHSSGHISSGAGMHSKRRISMRFGRYEVPSRFFREKKYICVCVCQCASLLNYRIVYCCNWPSHTAHEPNKWKNLINLLVLTLPLGNFCQFKGKLVSLTLFFSSILDRTYRVLLGIVKHTASTRFKFQLLSIYLVLFLFRMCVRCF